MPYSKEEQETILQRAKDFMIKKPEASRAKIALYAGCAVSILEKWDKKGLLKLPPKMTDKQRIKRSPFNRGLY